MGAGSGTSLINTATPIAVNTTDVYAYVKTGAFSSNPYTVIYVDKDGNMTARGTLIYNNTNNTGTYIHTVKEFGKVLSVTLSDSNSSAMGAIMPDGTIRTLGYNGNGQLGDSSNSNSLNASVPVGGSSGDGLGIG